MPRLQTVYHQLTNYIWFENKLYIVYKQTVYSLKKWLI